MAGDALTTQLVPVRVHGHVHSCLMELAWTIVEQKSQEAVNLQFKSAASSDGHPGRATKSRMMTALQPRPRSILSQKPSVWLVQRDVRAEQQDTNKTKEDNSERT